MMILRILTLLIGVVLALPMSAQDAGPLVLEPGMRAYTTRVFVEPEVLAELSVGDEVSFYNTYFTARNYPHAEGFDDTYVVETITQNLRILAIGEASPQRADAPLLQVDVRVAGLTEDIQLLALPNSVRTSESYFYPRKFSVSGYDLAIGEVVIMVNNLEELPTFCDECETLLVEDYKQLSFERWQRCYFKIRRGVEVTRTEIPCPATE